MNKKDIAPMVDMVVTLDKEIAKLKKDRAVYIKPIRKYMHSLALDGNGSTKREFNNGNKVELISRKIKSFIDSNALVFFTHYPDCYTEVKTYIYNLNMIEHHIKAMDFDQSDIDNLQVSKENIALYVKGGN